MSQGVKIIGTLFRHSRQFLYNTGPLHKCWIEEEICQSLVNLKSSTPSNGFNVGAASCTRARTSSEIRELAKHHSMFIFSLVFTLMKATILVATHRRPPPRRCSFRGPGITSWCGAAAPYLYSREVLIDCSKRKRKAESKARTKT